MRLFSLTFCWALIRCAFRHVPAPQETPDTRYDAAQISPATRSSRPPTLCALSPCACPLSALCPSSTGLPGARKHYGIDRSALPAEMGINGLWDILGPGQLISIAALSTEHFQRTGRPFRIAIDEPGWRFNNLNDCQVTMSMRQPYDLS